MLKKYFISSLRNTRGFSLTEALIGVGMIAGLAFVVAKFGTETPQGKTSSQARTCEAISQGVTEAITRRGVFNSLAHYSPLQADRSPGTPFSHAPIVPDTDLWGAANGNGGAEFNINALTSAGNYASNLDQVDENRAGYALIDGYMRTLAAIYNSNPAGFCSSWTPYASITVGNLGLTTDLLLDSNADGRGDIPPTIELQVLPYNTLNGATLGCPNVIRPIPPGAPQRNTYQAAAISGSVITAGSDGQGGSPSFTAANRGTGSGIGIGDRVGPLHSFASGSGTNIGFRLQVKVNYTEGGVDKSCESSQRYQYLADTNGPSSQPILDILSNNSVESVTPNYTRVGGTVTARTVTVRIRYPDAEPGVQLYCRDRSERLNYDTASGSSRSAPCFHGGAINPTWATRWPLDTSRSALPGVTGDWVPCDQVKACGVSPTPSRTAGESATDPPNLTLTYSIDSSRWGCDVIIDAIAVDLAGNRSDIAVLPRTSFRFANDNSASFVRAPRCMTYGSSGYGTVDEFGRRCDRFNTSHWTPAWISAYPNGYYTTRSTGCCYFAAAPYQPGTGAGNPGTCVPM